ncbi:hypothetical protein CEXT_587741 [Caerostris extrusa]|uniref:Uncharacterized protein n=1 Tax=Caerostris extrusa TaxID=172846 RepID=A0AAV4PTQ2_CAEEX|nr:hypothetical protein CEXT_587741 [Caerostris extrusa]
MEQMAFPYNNASHQQVFLKSFKHGKTRRLFLNINFNNICGNLSHFTKARQFRIPEEHIDRTQLLPSLAKCANFDKTNNTVPSSALFS